MRIEIDNNDGRGGVDYTAAVLRERPVTITRRRGQWAECRCGLDVLGAGLPMPAYRASVRVVDAGDRVLFAGYLAHDVQMASGVSATAGAEEMPELRAVEAGWLSSAEPVQVLQPASATEHTLPACDVQLELEPMRDADLSSLAADVTVSGEVEATAYVTELFRGDGSTATFALSHPPFRVAGAATLLDDSFDDAVLHAWRWTRVDAGGYLRLGVGGLQMNGGNGYDGATVLRWTEPVEMGGTLVAEATDVTFAAGSDGVLLGFYSNAVTQSACIAGVRVIGSGGARTLKALVNGVEKTATYTVADGHRYTLRVRTHCAEMQRVRATYRAVVDGAVQSFGGELVDAPLRVVMEVVDQGLASSTLPTVLWDGAIGESAARCIFAPVNSVQLLGSVGRVGLRQTGSAWVVKTATDGSLRTMREGAAGTAADFSLSASGVLTFDPGRVPQPGELVTVQYRRGRRAIARSVDATAAYLRGIWDLPGVGVWRGSVARPAARSTEDCANAAAALVALSAGTATGRRGVGTFFRSNGEGADVEPGDCVLLPGSALQRLPVTSVTVTDRGCAPEVLQYRVAFAQGRGESLDFTVSDALPADTDVPANGDVASDLPACLSALQVTVATTAALQVDSGVDAPAGGGFEVRGSDANFGSTSTADLVLQSPVRSFSIPRTAFHERFFVRMYDGSAPRKYSRWSSVVLTNLPV